MLNPVIMTTWLHGGYQVPRTSQSSFQTPKETKTKNTTRKRPRNNIPRSVERHKRPLRNSTLIVNKPQGAPARNEYTPLMNPKKPIPKKKELAKWAPCVHHNPPLVPRECCRPSPAVTPVLGDRQGPGRRRCGRRNLANGFPSSHLPVCFARFFFGGEPTPNAFCFQVGFPLSPENIIGFFGIGLPLKPGKLVAPNKKADPHGPTKHVGSPGLLSVFL